MKSKNQMNKCYRNKTEIRGNVKEKRNHQRKIQENIQLTDMSWKMLTECLTP